MARKFDGKLALITGAASGIGLATAQKLASLGATLALCDINAPALDAALASLPPAAATAPQPDSSSPGAEGQSSSAGPNKPQQHQQQQHTTHLCDVGSSADVDRTVAEILTKHGTHTHAHAHAHSTTTTTTIDFVFNCAGVNPTALAIGDTTDAYFDKLVDTNLRGPYNVTRAVVPHLQRGAAIVNVASVAGLRASWGFSIYCATKFGVIGFTKAMALELGPKGIRINCVAPGPTDTPTMAGNLAGGGENDRLIAGIALGRLGQPDDIADVVAFLFSEESRFMNGSVVEISGGQG